MTAEEERVLAWTLLGEAANQGRTGMEAVAFVIRNRTASGRFPSNPATVALQPGQFSTWNAISQGGNIPRARYSADSAIFQTALAAVRKVFSATPGTDPTQGATHYYAPNGMAGGAAPYWWNSESSAVGNVRVGGHIFAAKYDPKVAPTPATRSGGKDPIGNYPSKMTMDFMATGKQTPLPEIAKAAYDPIRKTVVRVGTTTTAKQNIEVQRKEQQAQRKVAAAPAKAAARVSVAGFSVPQGTTGIAVVDAERKLADNAKTEERLNDLRANQSNVERGVPRVQTKFAPDVAQPNGALTTKDETRLTSPKGIGNFSASDLARGKVKPKAPAPIVTTAPTKPPARVPSVVPRVQMQPVPAARKAVEITVHAAKAPTVAKALAMSPVDALRAQGLSASDAYSAANANAAQKASAGGKYTSDNASNNGGKGSGPGGSLQRGDRSFNTDTNKWQ